MCSLFLVGHLHVNEWLMATFFSFLKIRSWEWTPKRHMLQQDCVALWDQNVLSIWGPGVNFIGEAYVIICSSDTWRTCDELMSPLIEYSPKEGSNSRFCPSWRDFTRNSTYKYMTFWNEILRLLPIMIFFPKWVAKVVINTYIYIWIIVM